MKKKLVALVTALACISCSAPKNRASVISLANETALPHDSLLSVKINGDKQVRFLGYTNFDDAGSKGGQIMYPGGNAGVFLISVLTHSATVGSIKNAEKQRLQTEADKVLTPYRSNIDDFTTDTLVDATVKSPPHLGELKLTAYDQNAQEGWVIESSPVYFLTQDQSSIILQNPVLIYEKNNAAKPHYRNLVEIVFQIPPSENSAPYISQQGKLADISSALFSASLKLSIQDAQQQLAKNGVAKTFSYYVGKQKMFERGSLAEADCERLTIRTLHGWLKSVPQSAESASETGGCASAATEQKKSETM